MKFTISLIVLKIDKYLFDLIDSIINQTLRDFELIISLPTILDNMNCFELKERLKKYYNIKFIKLDTNNINKLRNNTIKIAKGDYVLFLDTCTKEVCDNFLEQIYKNVQLENLEIINFDYIEINLNLKHIKSCEAIRKERLVSKDRFVTSDINRGIDYYKYLQKKGINIDKLYCYCFDINFLKNNNISFNENTVTDSQEFLTSALIKAQSIKYYPVFPIKNFNYNIYNDNNYLEYNTLRYKLEKLKKYILFYEEVKEDIYKSKLMLKNIINFIEEMVQQAYDNNDYDSLMTIHSHLQGLDILHDDETLDFSIEIDVIIDCFNLLIREKNNNYKQYIKTLYTNIYKLNIILRNIYNKNVLDDQDINILIDILKSNRLLRKYKSYDKLKYYIIDCENKSKLNIYDITKNIRELIYDIESNVNSKLLYYRYYENKFDDILKDL